MLVSTSLDPPDRVAEIDSVIKTLTLSLRTYGLLTNVYMTASKAKLLLSQLRRERLRALTAVAKTHALLAEIELLVVQKQLDALKSRCRRTDAKCSSGPRLRKLSFRSKNNAKSGTKNPTSNSSHSSLHKLDKKSKTIAKTASYDTPCVTCVSNLAKSLNSLQIKKQATETPKYLLEVEPEETDLDKTIPGTLTNMKQDSIDITTPSKSEVVIISDGEDSLDSKKEASDTFPSVSTSPIARKIFGIANYNVMKQEKVAHSKKYYSGKPLQISPHKTKINKMKPLKKALNNIAEKKKSIKPTEDTKRENERKQSTEDTPPLVVSLSKHANKETKLQIKSNLSNRNTKEHTTLKVPLPLLSNFTNNNIVCKKSPTVDFNKIEKEKQQCLQYRDVIEKAEVTKEPVIEKIKEKQNVTETHPIRIAQKQEVRGNSITLNSKKEQKDNGKVTKRPQVRVSVSLPLTTSNLARFNRASQTALSKDVEKIQMEMSMEQMLKSDKKTPQASSLKVSIPLNSCTTPSIQTNPAARDKENLDKPECRNDERKESPSNQDGIPLVAWENINWGTWGARQRCNEENSQAEAVKRSKYKTWENGPIRKVSWETFTRRLNMSVLSSNEPCADRPTKKTCLEQRMDEDEKRLPTTSVADIRINKELMNPPTQPAETERRLKELCIQVIKQETADNHEAINAVFKQIMIKKENAGKPENTRSISSDQTAVLCTICQCLHETKVCPTQKYFNFLGVDNFKTEM